MGWAGLDVGTGGGGTQLLSAWNQQHADIRDDCAARVTLRVC
jgi:hypothetical protein